MIAEASVGRHCSEDREQSDGETGSYGNVVSSATHECLGGDSMNAADQFCSECPSQNVVGQQMLQSAEPVHNDDQSWLQ